jgi:predicted membrane protein
MGVMTTNDSQSTSDAPLVLRHTFGSTKRSGDWRVPAQVELHQRFGSAELDLTSAVLATPHVTLELDMIGGSVELRVPEDMEVTSTVATTFASFEDHRASNPTQAARSLTISGRAIWGSVEVRGPKKGLLGRG